jgi:hypothetical protein
MSSLKLLRHLAAFLCAFTAGFGAGFAVSHVISMFFAFGRAGIARIGTKLHELSHELRTPGIEPPAEGADVGTVAAEFDTGRHVMALTVGVTHFQAGSSAAFAGFSAFETGIGVAVVMLRRFHIRCCR